MPQQPTQPIGVCLEAAIMAIVPYRRQGTWVFDDADTGLVMEPFVEGTPAIIDELVTDIPGAEAGFYLRFSSQYFDGCQLVLEHVDGDGGLGHWYRVAASSLPNVTLNAQGWLCPALYRYFSEAPELLYVGAEPLIEDWS